MSIFSRNRSMMLKTHQQLEKQIPKQSADKIYFLFLNKSLMDNLKSALGIVYSY